MFGRTARTAMETRTGRRVTKEMVKGMFKAGSSRGGRGTAKAGTKGLFKVVSSRGGRGTAKAGTRGVGNMLKTGAKLKAGKEATKVGAKSASKAGRGFGKLVSKKGKREIRVAERTLKSERSSGGGRLFKFGLLALAGLGIGALVARILGDKDSTSTSDGPAGPGPEGAGDDTDRGHSDPSSGPLIGESHQGDIEGVTESQPEAEARIKTRIGEDDRTSAMPRVNVEVNGGVAELRGAAPSEEAKEAAGEIAAEAEGVSEVRNLIEVDSGTDS